MADSGQPDAAAERGRRRPTLRQRVAAAVGPFRRLLPQSVRDRRALKAMEARLAALQQAWESSAIAPFRAWLEPQIPSTDVIGPGGVRAALDALSTLSRFRAEMWLWMEERQGPPDYAALRNAIMVERREFDILHTFMVQRFPRVAPAWTVHAFTSEEGFWSEFKEAARQFEEGLADERLWVGGLTRLMAMCVSWTAMPVPDT